MPHILCSNLTILLFFFNSSLGYTRCADSLAKSSKIDSLFETLKNSLPNNAEVSAAIISNGAVTYLGFKKEKKKWLAVDNRRSVFEIGSITKVFTSTLLAHAVFDGVVDLDAPIASISPFPINGAEKDGQPITLVSLANHTSGLPRLPSKLMRSMITTELIAAYLWPYLKKHGNPYYGYTKKKFDKYLHKSVKLKTVPGTTFNYSNLGAALLGYLLVAKQHTDYETLLKKQIFNPLGMESSTTCRESVADRLVQGRNSAGKKVKNWDLCAMEAAGAVLSSTDDLAKFALANFKPDSVLDLQRKPTLTDGKENVALGWFIVHYTDGNEYVWHNGGTGGYSASMALDPTLGNAVILLTNIGGKNAILDSICHQLMERLLSEK
ncbi:beta-lactamase family protein [Parapedobacter sp. ISTM3]|uniref:serine hydrolase domain-containing protein n=1 Tax=Parapedobacter sp. ISTM3 TaxID=2800130 RepID=UPI0019084EB5|nr:serine hydrolase domain-containing protein [Parapedobacter sp. ISTM3]MBK1439850.1 beta-lactamase family protein [Parapedobacter sp. ISTM3]